MQLGMLWYDPDAKATLEAKIKRAAEYYRRKYAAEPDTCYVYPGTVAGEQTIGAVKVKPSSNILCNHFWMGRDA